MIGAVRSQKITFGEMPTGILVYCADYVDTRKQVGDKDHLKVFASENAAERWFAEHDPEGVAFEYPVAAYAQHEASRKPSTSSVAKCSRDHTNAGWRFVCTACGFAGSVNITPNWHDRKRGRAPFQVG
jgi:hypothetical protein